MEQLQGFEEAAKFILNAVVTITIIWVAYKVGQASEAIRAAAHENVVWAAPRARLPAEPPEANYCTRCRYAGSSHTARAACCGNPFNYYDTISKIQENNEKIAEIKDKLEKAGLCGSVVYDKDGVPANG